NGRVAEEGSHDDLVEQQDGIYRQLWSLQAQGFEPEE
ncbi:MAG: ABC transporter ATP-binding protein, partial [Candidatus Wildermuthbacteria bacterium]|nr:ABC transporter ATP-binding protein [Candidatus Wildermuthbacteria bacterium]